METGIYGQLVAYLRPLGRRLRLRSAADLLASSAWMALAAGAAVLLAGRLFPLARYRLAAGATLAAWLAGWAVYSLARPLRPFTVARRADRELGLRDRLSTALALAAPGTAIPAGFDRGLVSLQLDDALAVAQTIEPGRAFPVQLQRSPLVRAAAALVMGAALLLVPNPMDAVVRQRAQVAQAAQAEAARLEALAQELEQDASLTPEDKEALLRELRQFIAQLRSNPGEAKKALADLNQFQERMRSALDPAAPAQQAALDLLAQQVVQVAGSKDKASDLSELAELLEQLAAELDELSPEQRAALAGALEQAAARTTAGNPDLASALSALAQAAQSTPSEVEAARAATAAGQALREAAGQLARQQALARMLNQAGESQRAIARAAGSRSPAEGQGQAQRPGQGQEQGQGEGQGQGQGQGEGQGQGQGQGQGSQPGGGGGTNAQTLPPGVSRGTAGVPTGPDKPFSTSDLETVYAPLAAGEGQEEFVAGQEGPEGQTATREGAGPQPGASGAALVPYRQVYQQYAQVAGQAMERAYVPPGLQEYVKEYFSALEP